jgi:AAA+ ATPase superfamily predicted ATPase
MDFIGRKHELAVLREMYSKDGFCGAIVYGRRRNGKTTLIKESAEEFKGKVVYYQCLKAVDGVNARGLSSLVNALFPDAFVSENASFGEVLASLFRLSLKEPVLLILDEYPYLQNRAELDSFLQQKIDESLGGHMKLILSGSTIGVMQTLLNSDCPLHGRLPYKVVVEPFDYYDAAAFYPGKPTKDKIAFYSVFGGTPYYLSFIDPKKSLKENIISLLLRENAPLENEILTTMQQEYAKVESASLLMELITSGKHSFSDINASFRERTRSDLPYLLNLLVEMKLLSKTYAINDGREKMSYYEVADPLFAFYFQLVYPNLSARSIMNEDDFYSAFIADRLEKAYLPRRFETVCKEFLVRANKSGLIKPPFFRLGSYTYNDPKKGKNGQFDLVSEDEKGLVAYECKFTKDKVGPSVVEEEARQVKESPLGKRCHRLGFFSLSGYEGIDQGDGNLYWSADDLYSVIRP